MTNEPLWFITAFFCPVGHMRRLENFRLFRRHLKAPLLAVELGRPGCHHLAPEDADAIVRLTGDPQIWQKQRLLNIAVRHLPPEVGHVAWVDCDVAFDRPDWIAEARALLKGGKRFVQLFDDLARLPPLDGRAPHDIEANC